MSADVKSEDVALIARQISLVLVGVIILTSMRLVLRGVTRVGSAKFIVFSHAEHQTGSTHHKSQSGCFTDVASTITVDGTWSPFISLLNTFADPYLIDLQGIYLLSTIVQLRTSFPPPPIPPESVDEEDNIKNLFSTIPQFEVFGSLFNWSLLIAAGASGFARWAADKVNGPKEN